MDGFQIDEPPPDGFLFLGGDACLIQAGSRTEELKAKSVAPLAPESGAFSQVVNVTTPPRKKRRVLVALPIRAVDLDKAKMLARLQTPLRDRRCSICPLRRATQNQLHQVTVLEFEFPEGLPLSKKLQGGSRISEDCARELCRDLLDSAMGLHTFEMTLRGLLDASMVYIGDESDLGQLCGVLPISAVLTAHGAQRATLSVMRASVGDRLDPQLRNAASSVEDVLFDEFGANAQWDNYVIAAIVLQALTGASPRNVKDTYVQQELPGSSGDFLCKALHWEPEWRLGGEKSFAHPWLVQKSSPQWEPEWRMAG